MRIPAIAAIAIAAMCVAATTHAQDPPPPPALWTLAEIDAHIAHVETVREQALPYANESEIAARTWASAEAHLSGVAIVEGGEVIGWQNGAKDYREYAFMRITSGIPEGSAFVQDLLKKAMAEAGAAKNLYWMLILPGP